MPFDILGRVEALNATNLTIREQARLELNPLDLAYRAIAPEVATDDVRLSEITAVDFRPTGGRREWNAQPRELPERLGPIQNAEMVPINFAHTIDEYRLTRLRLRARGMAQLVDADIIADVDRWAQITADSCDRQIERDFYETWFRNQLTVRDPVTGDSIVVSANIAATRYVAAATTLAGAANAYTDFMGYLRAANAAMGSVGVARMRQARLLDILADAPAQNGDTMSLMGLQQRLNAEGFGAVTIAVDERTYDDPADGGSVFNAAYYVPTDRIAFQPADGRVGTTYVAPVARAFDYVDADRLRGLGRLNGVATFAHPVNDGKGLRIESQKNAISLLEERRVYVVTGV